jgi:hypothetical protein
MVGECLARGVWTESFVSDQHAVGREQAQLTDEQLKGRWVKRLE